MNVNHYRKSNLIYSGVLIAVLVVVDQIVKYIAYQTLRGQPTYSYLGGVVQIEYAENRGAFLSLGANLSDEARFWVFVIFVLGILCVCIYSLFNSASHRLMALSYALVIAGGVGNLIDRVSRGSVIDYIHMGFGSLRTGVFNIADVAISLGLILLIYLQFTEGKQTSEK